MCSYCGAVYLRSELWKDAQGLLNCPDEGTGRDPVTLGRMLAEDAVRNRRVVFRDDSFPLDHNDDPPPTGNPVPFNPDPKAGP
jgi:hypothetical protein